MSMIEGALESAARGLRVFRIRPGSKRPLRAGWQSEATSDPAEIRALWEATPAACVGVATGNGVVVIDVDYGHGIVDIEALDDLPLHTYAARTKSGGEHWYYRIGGETRVRNSVGRLGNGIDIRGDGGLVVAPPTPGYEVFSDHPIAIIPHSRLLIHKGTIANYEKSYMDGFAWCPIGEHVPEGGRNDYMLRAGARLAEIADSPEMLADMMLQHTEETCEPALSEEEIKSMVRWFSKELVRA